MNYHKSIGVLIALLTLNLGLSYAGRSSRTSDCTAVKQTFVSKPTVSATILNTPAHDDALQLCRFTNHSESRRVSCCSHDTENQMLLSAQSEYSETLRQQTSLVLEQLGPELQLKHHYERMLAISKRMTEYEVGTALYLHHQAGRDYIDDFYKVLENILIHFDRSQSMFSAADDLLDNLFVYVVREATTPSSRADPDPTYSACLKQNRKLMNPSPFPVKMENLATSLHYSAVAASYLSEAMGVMFQALNATRDFTVNEHCLRDIVKLNHCQKCYGYTEMRPCREFCEDVFLVCLNRFIRLDSNWEYHRKIIKILSEYILTRVDLQVLLNGFHTEFTAGLDAAIISYPSYKKQLEGICGSPKVNLNKLNRAKIWEKPSTTSYEGDFSGDLRKLVVNMELKIQGFYANLHTSICATEPPSGEKCWDGLTERVNKRKKILEFQDQFAPYPQRSEEVSGIIDSIKRIRTEVLKIFLKSKPTNKPDRQDADGEFSGSGDEAPDVTSTNVDDEAGDADEPPNGNPQTLKPLEPSEAPRSTVSATVHVAVPTNPAQPHDRPRSEQPYQVDIKEKTTTKTTTKTPQGSTDASKAINKSPVKDPDNGASTQFLGLTVLILWLNAILV